MATMYIHDSMSDFNQQFFDELNTGSAALPLYEFPYDINNPDIFGDEYSDLFKSPVFKSPRDQPSINNIIDNAPSADSPAPLIELPTELPGFDDTWLNNFDFSTLADDFTAAAPDAEIDSQYPEIFTDDIPPYPKDIPLLRQPPPDPSTFNGGPVSDDIDFSTFDLTQFNDLNNPWLPIEGNVPRADMSSGTLNGSESSERGLSYETVQGLFNSKFSWTEPHKRTPNSNSPGSGISPSHRVAFQAELKTLPQKVAGKGWIKTNKLTRGDNMRSTNASNIPQYSSLSKAPASWGTKQSDGLPLFRYTMNGELYPSAKFSAEHIYEYIFSHPLNITSLGYYNARDSSLVLWIGIAPADSARRYATSQSDKCRFKNCPVTHHSITKGTFRVTFDEQYFTDVELDPYNSAGICRMANVRADTREFRKEKNKAAITHNNPEFAEFVHKFKKFSQPWSESNPYSYKKTLCYKLTKGHLANESAARKKTRLARDVKMTAKGGFSNSLEKHLGNLDVFAANERKKRGQKEQKQMKQKEEKKMKSKKRKLTYTSFEGENDEKVDASLEARLETGLEAELEAELEENLEKTLDENPEDPEVHESPNSLFDEPLNDRPAKRMRSG